MMKKRPMTNKDLTLVGHLGELRKRLIISLLSLIGFSLIAYNFADLIAKDIIGRAPDMKFVYLTPSELMLSYIRIAIVCGIILAAPIIISQIWLFVSPGLEDKQKKYVLIAFFLGGAFFILGTIMAYIFALPLILNFFLEFQIPEIQAYISFSNFLNFVLSTLLAFGGIFELPIVMFLLTRFGLVKVEFYTKYRKYMVLVIFFVAAILTPPDVVSQILLAVPMLLLYEIGIIFSRIGQKKKEDK
ncbi:MAG: twin-arginine translocase subunit TatC [Tissierellaceae bacterium]|nr:twin-arginine translocase subunit TatC [Tissierellaceae bacterium]